MNPRSKTPESRSLLARSGRSLGRYFMRGILILAPIAITLAVVRWVFMAVDGLLLPYVKVPGIGFVIVVVALVLAGWIGSFLFFERWIQWISRGLDRLPGVSIIYSSVHDFFDAFIGNKPRFSHTVLVNVLAEEVWMVGFLTDEDVRAFELGAEFVSVYVPQSYNIAGQLYLVRRERIRSIKEITPGDAMKYAVTGGVVETSNRQAGEDA